MSYFETCEVCKDFVRIENHKCKPVYYVINLDYFGYTLEEISNVKENDLLLSEGEKVYEREAAYSAEKYYELNFSNRYDYDTDGIKVHVWNEKLEYKGEWEVDVEAVPVFSASKIGANKEIE